MKTNPNDYDPDELRQASDDVGSAFLGFGGVGDASGDPFGADEVLRSNQYRELFLLQQTTADGRLTRPYLEALPESYAAEILVFEWLEFLVDKAGFRRTLDILRYYRSIEWITDAVEARLREYLSSFDDDGPHGDLDRSDHLLSLVYVARLAAMD